MTKDEIKSTFQKLLGKGTRLEEIFNLLDKTIAKDKPISNAITLIRAQLARLNDENDGNRIQRSDYVFERNSIDFRLSNVIEKIEETDTVASIEDNEDKIDENDKEILVICRNDTDEFFMTTFCGQKQGLKCKVKQSKTYIDPKNYKFIIFDNHSIKNIDDKFDLKDDEIAHLNLMKEYINEYREHEKYMIHFGDNASIVNQNRDIVYSANSKFSLYSRIKEMEKYIRDEE
jgi:Effector-associated domain 11